MVSVLSKHAESHKATYFLILMDWGGYGQFRQDSLELLPAGFLVPLHHLVQQSVGLRHDVAGLPVEIGHTVRTIQDQQQ